MMKMFQEVRETYFSVLLAEEFLVPIKGKSFDVELNGSMTPVFIHSQLRDQNNHLDSMLSFLLIK